MNKYIFILFFSSLFAQIEYSNYLNFRYGDGAGDYAYDEIYSNLGVTLNRPEHRFEASLSLELSNPPEIGLKEEGVREFLLGYYNENFSLEFGDFYKTWGRGLILNQVMYQHLDFDTGARGISIEYQKDDLMLNVLGGESGIRKSTTLLGDYNPRVPNYFLDQNIYGSDLTLSSSDLIMGFSLLLTEQSDVDISSTVGGMRFEKSYKKGDLFLSFMHKKSERNGPQNNLETDKGNGIYLSNVNYIDDWSLTSNYRRYRIDIKNPSERDDIVNNYAQALDIQRSPTAYYQHNFKLLSRNSKQANLNDEVGLELELTGPLGDDKTLLVSYSKSSSTKGWHSDEFGVWNAEPLTITGGNSNSLFPSSDKDSYPFDEFFIELNGYNKSGNVFYRIGFDYLSDTFSVLTNSDVSESFEVNKAITFPSMVNITLNDLWSIEMQLELQRAKKGFETTNNGKSSFTSLLSEKYQKNTFVSLTANYSSKWSLTIANESTNSDEALSNFESNTWNSMSLTYKIKPDSALEVFYGSIRGGLDCTNGVCRYIQSFENGLRIDYNVSFD